jgi:hypothetical protein
VAPTRQPKAAQARSSATPSQARDACWRQVLLRRVAEPKKKKEKKEKKKKKKEKKKKERKKKKKRKKKEKREQRLRSATPAELPRTLAPMMASTETKLDPPGWRMGWQGECWRPGRKAEGACVEHVSRDERCRHGLHLAPSGKNA